MKDNRNIVQAFLNMQSSTTASYLDLTSLLIQLAATAPTVMYLLDVRDYQCVFINKRIYDMLGHSLPNDTEVHTDLLIRLIHPDDVSSLYDLDKRFENASNEDIITSEFRLRHLNGQWRWFSSRSVVFQRNEEGKPYQILSTAEDFTDRRQAEIELRDKASQLQTILDTAVDAILTINDQGIVESFNIAAEKIFGYQAIEVIGQNVKMLMPYPYHSEHDIYLQNYRQTGVKQIIGIGREVTGKRKDGSLVPLDLAVSEAWVGRRVFTGILRDLTAQRAAEAAMQQQAYLLEHAQNAIIVRDIDGTIRYWNKGAVEMYGWSKEDAIGRITHELLQTQLPVSLAQFLDDLETEELWEGELTHTRFDGEKTVVTSRQMMPRDEEGNTHGILEINTDVTAQKHSEAMLKESDTRLNLALGNAGLGTWDWDLTTNKIIYDSHWYELLGYTPDELAERIKQREHLTHPDDLDRLNRSLNAFLENQTPNYIIEFRTLHKNGEWIWIDTRGKVHSRDEAGKPLRIIGTIQDITARKKAEQILHESEARFRHLADSTPVFIWTSGLDTTYDYFNKPWLDFTGRTMQEEIAQSWQSCVHEEDVERSLNTYLTAFEARTRFRLDYRLLRHDGEYRWFLNIGTPRFSPDGTFLGYIGSCIDTTDQKILQEQLFESQKLESMGRLAGGISHDFNNLLTAILGYTELSIKCLPEDTEVRPFLDNVNSAAMRAAELTKQLLMYARRQMVEFSVVDINQVIMNMHPLLRRTIGEQYELITSISSKPCCVRANVSQMEQVLTNLVVNARDAMPHGGRILIETSCITLDEEYAEEHLGTIPGEYVMYSVSDTGIGMSTEVRNRIFEPFYTTKEIGKGTGLGLATCYGIVKQTKGNIWVYSEPGSGTTFKVYIPRIHDEVFIESTRLPESVAHGTETILLVDDEPMVRDIAARTLRSHGYRVLEAGNGAEALQRHSEWSGEVHLLISDVVMPIMGGKELAQRLTKLNPKLKVMYLSGYTQNIVLNQDSLKPEFVLLTKPFTSSALLTMVSQVLKEEQQGTAPIV